MLGMGRFGAGSISVPHRPHSPAASSFAFLPACWPQLVTEGIQPHDSSVWAEPCPVGAPAPRAPGLAFQEEAETSEV